MMALIRLVAIIIAIEALFYVLLSIYIRSLRREALEKEWDQRHPEKSGASPERREFVRRSMVGFEKTLRARLIGWVMVLPVVAIVTIIFFVNYY